MSQNEVVSSFNQSGGSIMSNIKVLGIDLAKDVFQLHGTDAKGKKVLSKRLSRAKLTKYMGTLSPCLVGLEACGSSHYWARVFREQGHTVKMMAPQFVKPYVKSNKNDSRDAEGIAEAVTRPTMRFVPIKNREQQDLLLLHRVRELSMKQRTAQGNQIRGLLAEYGVIVPKGIAHLARLPELLEEESSKLTPAAQRVFIQLYEQFKMYMKQVEDYEHQIEHHAAHDPRCIALQEIEGIGPITASALVASISDPGVFKNGREVSAWIGLVPRQFSSGNKVLLGGIGKRGDRYLKKLLIHGGRSVVRTCEKKTDRKSEWVKDKLQRGGFNKASVAVANKNARVVWALLATGECYRKTV